MEKSTHTPEYAWLRSELRRCRERAGLSQRDVAERLKVPHSWIAKVETGERRIDLIELGWFLSACGADPMEVCQDVLRRLAKSKSGRQAAGGRSK